MVLPRPRAQSRLMAYSWRTAPDPAGEPLPFQVGKGISSNIRLPVLSVLLLASVPDKYPFVLFWVVTGQRAGTQKTRLVVKTARLPFSVPI